MDKDERVPRLMRDPQLATIGRQAAEWLGRRELGLTPEEQGIFRRWLDADERHVAAFREMEGTWEFLDGMKEIARPAFEPVEAEGTTSGLGMRRWLIPAVVAAGLALAFFAPRRFQHRPDFVRAYTASAAGMEKIELPDGSVVHLNADSAVEIRFSDAERRVSLARGEASFSVAKTPSRPFIVRGRQVSVIAVGTVFDVRVSSQEVDVLVTEGRVRVEETAKGKSLLAASAGDGTPVLGSGHRAVIRESATAGLLPAVVTPLASGELDRDLAWQAKRLTFDQTPLAQVVAEFNRFNEHQIVIADPKLAVRRFGGTLRADNYESLVAILKARFGVVAERAGETTILRCAK